MVACLDYYEKFKQGKQILPSEYNVYVSYEAKSQLVGVPFVQ